MGKKRAKPKPSKASPKKRTKPLPKASNRPKAPASLPAKKRIRPAPAPPPVAAIEPSHIQGHVTARRIGRPPRLTHAFVEAFISKLSLGLHLEHVGALLGARGAQISEWLRDGRRDIEARPPRDTVAAAFSKAVSAELARIQQQELGSLAVYQRMAEGWSPTCPVCLKTSAPCGKHRKNLRLAADLARWKLVHRFPAQWNRSTVSHEVGGVGDDGATPNPTGMVAGLSGEEGARPAAVAVGLVIFMPKRNDMV